jgi:hypothetical protein
MTNVGKANALMVMGLLWLCTTPSYDETWDYLSVNFYIHGAGALMIFAGCEWRERIWAKSKNELDS